MAFFFTLAIASLARFIAKCSVCAFTPCLAATSIISRNINGLPIGLPVMDLVPATREKGAMEIGSGGTPRKHSVPIGRRAVTYAIQSWSALIVERMRSKLPASCFNVLRSEEHTSELQ